MKKLLITSLLLLAGLSYGADTKIMSTLQSIESKYNDLLQREEAKKREFENERLKLKNEIIELKEKEKGKEVKLEKLRKDSEVRWLRDDYKKLLNEYEAYYKNITKNILEREQRIAELEKLLASMQ